MTEKSGDNQIPFLSKPYVNQIPQLGYGIKLFRQIDEAQHGEKISPQLAEAMRKALTAKGISEPRWPENTAIAGDIKFAITSIDGMLQSAAKAMERHGEGNEGEIIVEWLDWLRDDDSE